MKTMTAAEAKQNFGRLIDAAQREPVMITKHGHGASVMISAEDYAEQQKEKEFYMYQMIKEGLEDVKSGRVHSLDEINAELDSILAAYRTTDAA